jgi:hypothetical protein
LVFSAVTRDAPNQIKVFRVSEHSNETLDYTVEVIHSVLLGRRLASLTYDWAAKNSHQHAPSMLHALIGKLDAKGIVPMAGYIQADKRVEVGIDTVRAFLDPKPFDKSATPLLVINPSQESGGPILRSELMGYCKTEDTAAGVGKIIKKNDHVADCVRYACRTFPYWSSAYCCGHPTFVAEAPMQSDPHRLSSPTPELSYMERRAQLSAQLGRRTKASIRAAFMPRR